jgi:hypothetical protein
MWITIKKILSNIVLSFLTVNLIFFVVSIFIQPPHWNDSAQIASAFTNGLSNALKNDAHYRNTIANIFYTCGFLFLLASVPYMTSKKNRLHNPIPFLAITSFIFAFSSTRGHQWYFQFAVNHSWHVWQLLMIAVMFISGIIVTHNYLNNPNQQTDFKK